MVEKLSADDRSRLEQALASWESWQPVPKVLPEVMSQLGGDSNLSFVVSDGSSQWVLRLNNPVLDGGINRDNERRAQQAAYGAGISPKPNFQTSEMLVTPFITGRHATLNKLSQIGNLFGRIHALPVRLAPLDLRRHLDNYYEKSTPDTALRDCYQHIMALYPEESVDLKPCHNDLLLPNIIESKQELQVLDWEYAAAADPAYDLAVFSSTYDLKEEGLGLLLSGYELGGIQETQGLVARIEYFEKYYRLIEVLWWRLRGRDMGVELKTLARSLS